MKIHQHIAAFLLVTVVLTTVYGSVQLSYRDAAIERQRQEAAEDLQHQQALTYALRIDMQPAARASPSPVKIAEQRTAQLRLMILVAWAFCVCVICFNAALPLLARRYAVE